MMPLFGPLGLLVLSGAALYLAGFWLAWKALGRHGGQDRARMLSVVFDDDSPMKRPEARGDRARFRVGVFLMAFGIMNVFGGLSMGESHERGVCANACRRAGYYGGSFAPSAHERDASGAPQRGCWCAGPAGSVELEQPALPPLPSSPARLRPARLTAPANDVSMGR